MSFDSKRLKRKECYRKIFCSSISELIKKHHFRLMKKCFDTEIQPQNKEKT